MSDKEKSDKKMTARDLAVRALADRGGNVSAHLERLVEQSGDPSLRPLARELAMGVVCHKITLKCIRRALMSKTAKAVHSTVNNIINVALYQMFFLDRIPDFAAVNEAVEQTIKSRHYRHKNLVNAVLRNSIRIMGERQIGQPPLSSKVLPVASDKYYRCEKTLFKDPKSDPAGYLAEAFSLPDCLSQRWLKRFGHLKKVVKLAYQCNSRAPLIARVNTLKTSVGDVLKRLADDGVAARAHVNGLSIVADDAGGLLKHQLFTDGWVQPQDPTASEAVMAAAPKPGMNVLDFCAAPGTKTTFMAEMMNNTGSILAVDVGDKLENIEANCRRMGIDMVTTLESEKILTQPPESFDLVFVDVPCSNTGVLARRPEARWRFERNKLLSLVRDQQFLLMTAAMMVKRGGKLVYSTCSIEPEECRKIVEMMLKRFPHMSIVRDKQTMPAGLGDDTQWRDGGYYAVIRA